MKRLLAIALLVCGGLHAVETDNFSDLLDLVDNDCLLVCDIDNTLIRPAQYLGSTNWSWSYVKKLESHGLSREDALAEMNAQMKPILLCSKTELVDQRIPSVIADLQVRGARVMGYTSRDPHWGFVTTDALRGVGIDLTLTAPCCSVDDEAKSDFIEGVLLTDGLAEKGQELARFLEGMEKLPRRVVIVDDRNKSLQKTLWAIQDAGIDVEVVGVWYRAGEEWYRNFDPQLTEIQLTHFGRIISDEDALKLLEANLSE